MIIESFFSLKIDVYLLQKKRPGQNPLPPLPNVHGTFLVTKSICESSLKESQKKKAIKSIFKQL